MKQDKQVIKILPARKSNGLSDAAVERVGNCAYVALYGPFKYKLFAIDQNDGRIMWSSTVWGHRRCGHPVSL